MVAPYFFCSVARSSKLELEVFNKELFSDEFLGFASVDLGLLSGATNLDYWYPLRARTKKQHVTGEIHLKITYHVRIFFYHIICYVIQSLFDISRDLTPTINTTNLFLLILTDLLGAKYVFLMYISNYTRNVRNSFGD